MKRLIVKALALATPPRSVRLAFAIRAMERAMRGPGVTPSYRIIREFIDPRLVARFIPGLLHIYPNRFNRRQTGMELAESPKVAALMAGLAHRLTGGELQVARSAFRVQEPNGLGRLSPHQDWAPIGREQGRTLWVALCDIDEFTPTIAIYPSRYGVQFAHEGDELGYSRLLAPWTHAMIPISPLRAGDCVALYPDTIHETYVPSGATSPRYSLDLRVWL